MVDTGHRSGTGIHTLNLKLLPYIQDTIGQFIPFSDGLVITNKEY